MEIDTNNSEIKKNIGILLDSICSKNDNLTNELIELMDVNALNTKIHFKNYGPDCTNFTVLHQACINGTFNAIKQLCEKGVDINALLEDENGTETSLDLILRRLNCAKTILNRDRDNMLLHKIKYIEAKKICRYLVTYFGVSCCYEIKKIFKNIPIIVLNDCYK